LSDEAYEMRNRSAQECMSDELDGGLAYSDEEDDGFRGQLNQKKAAWKKAPARVFR
jgi:hypothetical protein